MSDDMWPEQTADKKSSLDDKIILAVLGKELPEGIPTPNFVEKVKQACQCVVCEKEGGVLMCGQCYYDRFVREYHMRADWISADPTMGDDAELDVLSAAKKAAGIE